MVIKMDVSTKHADAGPAAAFASSYLRSPCIKLNGVVVRGRTGCLRGLSVSYLLLRTLGRQNVIQKPSVCKHSPWFGSAQLRHCDFLTS